MRQVIFLAIIVFLSISVLALAGGKKSVTFEMLKNGKNLFEDNCIECHDLEWPLGKVTDRAGWEETLTKMANSGAVFDPADRSLVIEYLLAKSTFQKNCVSCHDEGVGRALNKKRSYEDWLATVKQEVARKPGILTAEEITAVSGYLTLGD